MPRYRPLASPHYRPLASPLWQLAASLAVYLFERTSRDSGLRP